MRPHIQETGNFLAFVHILINNKEEVLVEVVPGGFSLPSSVVQSGEMDKGKQIEQIAKEKLHGLLKVQLMDQTLLCTLVYEEDFGRFDCQCYVSRNWVGEIEKRTEAKRLMWVNKEFAQNVLSADVDKKVMYILNKQH